MTKIILVVIVLGVSGCTRSYDSAYEAFGAEILQMDIKSKEQKQEELRKKQLKLCFEDGYNGGYSAIYATSDLFLSRYEIFKKNEKKGTLYTPRAYGTDAGSCIIEMKNGFEKRYEELSSYVQEKAYKDQVAAVEARKQNEIAAQKKAAIEEKEQKARLAIYSIPFSYSQEKISALYRESGGYCYPNTTSFSNGNTSTQLVCKSSHISKFYYFRNNKMVSIQD